MSDHPIFDDFIAETPNRAWSVPLFEFSYDGDIVEREILFELRKALAKVEAHGGGNEQA